MGWLTSTFFFHIFLLEEMGWWFFVCRYRSSGGEKVQEHAAELWSTASSCSRCTSTSAGTWRRGTVHSVGTMFLIGLFLWFRVNICADNSSVRVFCFPLYRQSSVATRILACSIVGRRSLSSTRLTCRRCRILTGWTTFPWCAMSSVFPWLSRSYWISRFRLVPSGSEVSALWYCRAFRARLLDCLLDWLIDWSLDWLIDFE